MVAGGAIVVTVLREPRPTTVVPARVVAAALEQNDKVCAGSSGRPLRPAEIRPSRHARI